MPKLSARSLAKRFPCPYCGQSLRTRQGISGHIQWKHMIVKETSMVEVGDAEKKIQEILPLDEAKQARLQLQVECELAGFSKKESQAIANIIFKWRLVQLLCKAVNVVLNYGDYKTFLITSFTLANESEEMKRSLKNELGNEFKEILKEYMAQK